MNPAFAFPDFSKLPLLSAPPWLLQELRRRFVLQLNYVAQKVSEALDWLASRKGQVVVMEYAQFAITSAAVPADY